MSSTSRTYKEAIDHLNSVQSNAATIEALRASGGRMSDLAIPEMVEYLGRIGYSPSDLNRLNVIHITGTKGKGSTSAFTNSVLCQAKPEWKVGLYTSPHLVAVRERIRINGVPISEDDFTKFFFEVWDRLETNDTRANPSTSPKPAYFRMMTLVAFHAFLSMKVNATILEVGVGGRYDSTNIVPRPMVAGVTSLGLDHTTVLGKTIAEIAWQKAGIYKEGVPALTVDQPEEGMRVLEEQARGLKASEFLVVPPMPGLSDVKLGLAGVHQYQNANLAIHLVKAFLREKEQETIYNLPKPFVKALETTKWPGRCQIVQDLKDPRLTWFLDGAHTVESLTCCMQWFVSLDTALRYASSETLRVLVFNCTHGRSARTLLGAVVSRVDTQLQAHVKTGDPGLFFDHVIFCTNVTYADGGFKGDLTAISIPEDELQNLTAQRELASAWSALVPTYLQDHIHVLPSVEHAVNLVRELQLSSGKRQVDALVAGSLHLVGGMIEVAGLSSVAL